MDVGEGRGGMEGGRGVVGAGVEGEEAAVVGEDDEGGGGSGEVELAEARIGEELSEGGADGGTANDGGRWQLYDDVGEYVKRKVQDVKPYPCPCPTPTLSFSLLFHSHSHSQRNTLPLSAPYVIFENKLH